MEFITEGLSSDQLPFSSWATLTMLSILSGFAVSALQMALAPSPLHPPFSLDAVRLSLLLTFLLPLTKVVEVHLREEALVGTVCDVQPPQSPLQHDVFELFLLFLAILRIVVVVTQQFFLHGYGLLVSPALLDHQLPLEQVTILIPRKLILFIVHFPTRHVVVVGENPLFFWLVLLENRLCMAEE